MILLPKIRGQIKKKYLPRALLLSKVLVLSLLLFTVASLASQLDKAVKLSIQGQKTEQNSQKKVADWDDRTQDMLLEYRELQARIQGMQSHNQQLEARVKQQNSTIDKLHTELEQIDISRGEVTPMLPLLMTAIETLIEKDIPFKKIKRANNVKSLKLLLSDASLPLNKQLSALLKAYETEYNYGNELTTWKGVLINDPKARMVDYLQLGRIGFYYQTLDRNESGRWDGDTQKWHILSQEHARLIEQAIKKTSTRSAPVFVTLPVASHKERCCQ